VGSSEEVRWNTQIIQVTVHGRVETPNRPRLSIWATRLREGDLLVAPTSPHSLELDALITEREEDEFVGASARI